MAKGRKTGGRLKGSLNKAGRDVRAAAQEYTDEAIDVLVAAMRGDNMPLALTAANNLLDRGHGKPAQALTGEDGGPITIRVMDDWARSDSAK